MPLTPCAKKDRKAHPKTAGRKPEGVFRYRQAPTAQAYSQPPIPVPINHSLCPVCGGKLAPCTQEIVTRTDLPQLPAPLVTASCVEICRALSCGQQRRGQPPDLPASQPGATAHRLGARALASAHLLPYQLGIPVRKVPAVLQQWTGLSLTQSALTQAAVRAGCEPGAVAQAYRRLRHQLSQQPVIHTDEPEGGKRAYLMAFDSPKMRVYQIREPHRNEEVRELLGEAYGGVLSSARGKRYDAKELTAVKQQKCLAHIQGSLGEVLGESQGRERDFGEALKSQLKEAQEVKRQPQAGRLSGKAAERARSDIEREIQLPLRQRGLAKGRTESLRQQQLVHHERGNLLRFLHEAAVEATNNAAERALRPAGIARKVSQGTKTARGSRAFEAFTSVIGTQVKPGSQSVVESLRQLLERAPPVAVAANLPR